MLSKTLFLLLVLLATILVQLPAYLLMLLATVVHLGTLCQLG